MKISKQCNILLDKFDERCLESSKKVMKKQNWDFFFHL